MRTDEPWWQARGDMLEAVLSADFCPLRILLHPEPKGLAWGVGALAAARASFLSANAEPVIIICDASARELKAVGRGE